MRQDEIEDRRGKLQEVEHPVDPDPRNAKQICELRLGHQGVLTEGIGIPPDRLSLIFEAFQQVDSSTSRKYAGTGLGLTISRSLCDLMGYQLIVSSEEGKGSTFSIILTEGKVEQAAQA